MKTRRDARVWVYRDLTAASLRKKAASLKPEDIRVNGKITPAGLKRAQAEILKLAGWLEGKAAKIEHKTEPRVEEGTDGTG
jgi:hypothetical protein